VRRTGLIAALMRAVFGHCVEEYAEGVIAIVVENFAALQKVGAPTRRYALYGRPID
jgi:hypothetical protein